MELLITITGVILIGVFHSVAAVATQGVVIHVTDNGADPTGLSDSTSAIQATINQAFDVKPITNMIAGVKDHGGAEVHLDGGEYLISEPLTLPPSGGGNVIIHGGTLRASNKFPSNGYLLEFGSSEARGDWKKNGHLSGQEQQQYTYEDIIVTELVLDANFSASGGILLLSPLRTTIRNCYITHFLSIGITVQGGHETLIETSFLGQYITAGGDPRERNFSGTGILLGSNDNIISNTIIFSAQIGIEIHGQANTFSNIHCYNKATGWGGIGIVVRSGASSNRFLGCYLDYTNILLEETSHIVISNSYFLGDAHVLIKPTSSPSSPFSISGLSVTHNIFTGRNNGIPIAELDGDFHPIIKQTSINYNSAAGMSLRSTSIHSSMAGFGPTWTFDPSQSLLFPNSIAHVQYSFYPSPTDNYTYDSSNFDELPRHNLLKVSYKNITIASDKPVYAAVSIYVDQSFYEDNPTNNYKTSL